MLTASKTSHNQIEFFAPDEHAVLSRWLAHRYDAAVPADDLVEAMARLGIEDEPHDLYRPIDAAVANIVLCQVERFLPQWVAVYPDRTVFARQYREPDGRGPRKASLLPMKMFTINWADSGPGFSWPEEYRVTYLPLFNRYVVTASADSPDAWGYCDFALGSIPSGQSVVERACRIVARDWRRRMSAGQPRWQGFWSAGTVDEARAQRMADRVWGRGARFEY